MTAPATVRVHTPQPYDVLIGTDLADCLAPALGPDARHVALVHPRGLDDRARRLALRLTRDGLKTTMLPVPDGEAAKTPATLTRLWTRLADAGLTRTDALVGLGGGATTDLAALAAATWLRGVRTVLLPTTLLGMVDAAIGGKTAVNLPQGKNLVGAFHQPAAVLCDLDDLATLPPADYSSGLAEVVKAGFVADPAILDLIETDPRAALDPAGPVTARLIERAVSVKAAAVAADPQDHGLRETLNYGHTLGHAVEQVERYRIRHGEAVAIGMVYAARLSHLAGRLSTADADRHQHVLSALGLPTTYHRGSWPQLRTVFTLDKKTRGQDLRFIVLHGPGKPAVLTAPDDDLLTRAFHQVSR